MQRITINKIILILIQAEHSSTRVDREMIATFGVPFTLRKFLRELSIKHDPLSFTGLAVERVKRVFDNRHFEPVIEEEVTWAYEMVAAFIANEIEQKVAA